MNHWHSGDRDPMPKFVDKFRQMMGDGPGEVHIRPGAGDLYEDRFSYYWLVTGWSVFIFNILAMFVVVVHMSTGMLSYAWLPHLAGMAIIDAGIAFMAIIYRFVLFPAPMYRSHNFAVEGMPTGEVFGYAQPGRGYPPQPQPYYRGPSVVDRGPGAASESAAPSEAPPTNGRAKAVPAQGSA